MNKDLSEARSELLRAIDVARDGELAEPPPSRADLQKQRRRAIANRLERTAVNKRKAWTPKEDEVVLDGGLTMADKAELLGRTLSAVETRRKRLRWGNIS